MRTRCRWPSPHAAQVRCSTGCTIRTGEAQYTRDQFTVALAEHDILASMGSVGDAYDNAMTESLVDTFKTELISDRVWRTRSQLEVAIARWVSWYNNQRLHSKLGDIPPVEFETAHELEQILQLAGFADRC